MSEEENTVLLLDKEVYDEFNHLMITTSLGPNELLSCIMGVYKRYRNGSLPNEKKDLMDKFCHESRNFTKEVKGDHVEAAVLNRTNGRDVTLKALHFGASEVVPNRKSQKRQFKAKRRVKKSSKSLIKSKILNTIDVPSLDVGKFTQQLGSLEIGDENVVKTSPHHVPVDIENLSSRRSSRKATSPKRKQTEAMQLGIGNGSGPTEALDSDKLSYQNAAITPKRRRKNKPQKLVQQVSVDDNSASEPENEIHSLTTDVIQSSVNSLQHTQYPRERKSKTNARAVIGEIAGALLDETQEIPAIPQDATGIEKSVIIDNVESDEVEENSLFDIPEQKSPLNISVENVDGDDKPKALWSSLEYISIPAKVGRPKGSKSRPPAERRPYKCEHCQASFKRPAHLARHMDCIHSGYAPHRCRGCGKAVNSEMTLRYHEGFGCKVLLLPFQCNICLIRFDSKHDVSSHKCSGDSKKKCACPNCDYKTASPRDLEQHVRIHTGDKSFKCDQCDFSTAWKKNLKEHALKHSGVKPFVCDVCGFATNDPHNLRAHKFTHLTEKAFMCEICGAKFREARLLKGHQLVHSSTKPFKCHLCKYSCKHKSSLRYHVVSHSNTKKFMCEQCGQSFRSKRHMTRHQKMVHQDSDMIYGCRYCDFTAPVSQSLNSHMRKHSKKNKKLSPGRHSQKTGTADDSPRVSAESLDISRVRRDQIGELFRFESPQQENSQQSLCSSAVNLLPNDMKPLDDMASMGTQELHDTRSIQSPLLSQLSISPGDVLAVLPCFNTNSSTFLGASSNPEQADGIRPQYEELLFNSNASQAETISTMMSLIREFRPR